MASVLQIPTEAIGLEKSIRQAERRIGRLKIRIDTRSGNALGSITGRVADFDKALGAATNRVVAFGVAAGVFVAVQRAFDSFVRTTIEVEQGLAKINVNLNTSAEGLQSFGRELFNIARQTGQTFNDTAKAAEELARQGLGAEETLRRLRDALVLSRLAGSDSITSVESLTAAINSFSNEVLTSSEVLNRFVAVDTRFAVSTRDLQEAISRVGSSASEVGVTFNELLAIVTSVQQTTARGGAVIGNAFKTIFTRIQRPEVLDQLQQIGIAVRDTEGNTLPALQIIQSLAKTYDTLSSSQKSVISEQVAGVFQINILKAALGDLNREFSVYDQALRTAANATDEAIRKNQQLNQTLATLLNATRQSVAQLFATIGDQSIDPLLRNALGLFDTLRGFFSGESGNQLGESLGNSILQGFTNVITGPAFTAGVVVLGRALLKVSKTISGDFKTLLSINAEAGKRAAVQAKINVLLRQATDEERAQLAAARTTLQQKQAILAISERIAREELLGTPLQRAFLRARPFPFRSSGIDAPLRGVPNFARDPITEAIEREKASGVPASQIYIGQDPRLRGPRNPAGLLIANRRDEPLGGFQGVNRVLSQGGDPKKAGLIPNFAPPITRQDFISRGQFVSTGLLNELNKLLASLGQLDSIRIKNVAQEIRTLTSNFNKAAQGLITGNILTAQRLARFREGRIITDQSIAVNFTPPQAGSAAENLRAVREQNRISSKNIETLRRQGKLTQTDAFFLSGRRGRGGAAEEPSIDQQREAFVSRRIEERRQFAFGRARERFVSGRRITPAQERLIQEQAREAAILRGREFLAPGTSRQARSAFEGQFVTSQLTALSRERRGQILGRAIARGATARRAALEQSQLARARREQRLANVGLGTAIAAPFAAGFLPEGAGGTGAGIGLGAARGALQGVGIGGIFGPAGIALGAAIGGLIGAFGKLSKSAEELNEEFSKGSAARTEEIDVITQVLTLRESLRLAQERADSPDIIRRLETQLIQANARIRTPQAARVLAATSTDDAKKNLVELEEQNKKLDAIDEIKKLLASGNVQAGDLRNQLTRVISPENISQLNASDLGRIARGEFQNAPIVTNVRGRPSDESIREIARRNQEFISAANEIQSVLKTLGIEGVSIERSNINEIARAILSTAGRIRTSSRQVTTERRAARELRPGAFLSGEDPSIFRDSAFAGQARFGTRGQRAQALFQSQRALVSQGFLSDEDLESRPQFRAARAVVQRENILGGAAELIRGAIPSAGPLQDPRGNFFQNSIIRLLEEISRGTNQVAATNAKDFIQALKDVDGTFQNLRERNVAIPPETRFLNGFQVGVRQETFAGTGGRPGSFINRENLAANLPLDSTNFINRNNLEQFLPNAKPFDLVQQLNKAQDIAAKTIEAANNVVVRTALSVDGTIKVFSDTLSAEALESLSKELTERVGKRFEAKIRDVNNRVSRLENRSVPPTVQRQ